MIGEVYGGISAFKSLMDIAKGLKDIKDAPARNSAIIELQEKIFAAHEAQSSLIQKVRTLEEELARLKKWEGDKKQYKLTGIGTGAVAYAPEPNTDLAKTPHWICAKCYDKGERSFLQNQGRTPKNDENIYKCGTCFLKVVSLRSQGGLT